MLTAAESARRTGLREAAEPELPLADDLAHRLALAAKAVTGSFTHYSAPVGGGTRAWFLLDDADLALPAPSVPRVVRTLSEGLLRHGRRPPARRRVLRERARACRPSRTGPAPSCSTCPTAP